MQYIFSLMDQESLKSIQGWRYEGPYVIYSNMDSNSEMMDRRSPYYAVRNEQGELIGYFCFGTSALVGGYSEPSIYTDNEGTIAIGLGMRPNLTGKGLGEAFVQAGLDFARRTFAPKRFQLFVYTWNERAIRIYEKVGFQRTRVLERDDERTFLEMSQMVS